MRVLSSAVLLLATVAVLVGEASAKKPSRPRTVSGPPRGPSGGSSSRRSGSRPPSGRSTAPRKRRYEEDEFLEEEEEDIGLMDEFDDEEEDEMFEEEEEEMLSPPPRSRKGGSSRKSRPPPSRSSPPPSRSSRPPAGGRKREYYPEDDYDDDYDRPKRPSKRTSHRGPPGRSGGRHGGGGGGRVVPYGRHQAPPPTAFSRGLDAIRSSIPDATAVKEAAVSSISAARETTSLLSSNIYREVKGLTSSELEQVMLKATRPDDTPVKGKHVERLVGVTYTISSRYDIYDAVLRKLWSKMAEKDWRTTMKALYILHRFSADGSPEHAPALKARLRELRRTQDPKRKDKYFNSKQLLAGEARPDNIKFRAFMSRYAHYVLLRAQCFGGVFDEISEKPGADTKKGGKQQRAKPKPITSTSLRSEHLEAAAMLLKAGVACQLKDGEECENTAIAVERVASDLIGLTTAVAIALNRALKEDDLRGADPALIKRWCEFYGEELLPQSRGMVKKTSAKLDAYGLFLPSRMGASVAPAILQKGLNAEEEGEEEDDDLADDVAQTAVEPKPKQQQQPSKKVEEDSSDEEEEEKEVVASRAAAEVDEIEKEEDLYDEYEYEEEEYYDDEDV